jgi:acetoin utilization protein AcuB
MQSRRIRHLPVVEGDRLVGIVTDRDLRTALPSPLQKEGPAAWEVLSGTRVGEVMTKEVISAIPEMPMEDAAEIMLTRRIGALPVVHQGKLVGIITVTDVLRAFAETLGVGRPSSRFEVEIGTDPRELARLVEDICRFTQARLCSIVTPPAPSPDRIMVVIRVGTIDPGPIVRGLQASGFRVGWPFLERP